MSPVRALAIHGTREAEVILCVCCAHIPGIVEADATLVIKKVPPHALMAPLSTICAKTEVVGKIFRWIEARVDGKASANIKVCCCHACAQDPSLNLLPTFGRNFHSRCRDIERIIASMYRAYCNISCSAREVAAPPKEDGTVSGVRTIPLLQGGSIEFFDPLSQ